MPGADRGLGADPLAGGERLAEEPVHDRAGGPLDERELVGALDLALDLGLADDHRVEPGRDAEQVARGVVVAKRVEVRDQLGRPDVGLAGEDPERGRLGLDVVADREVELGAVAGRERDRLVDVLGRDELPQHARGAALRQRDALAQLDRRGLVGDAEREQLAHRPLPCAACSRSSAATALEPSASVLVLAGDVAGPLLDAALDPGLDPLGVAARTMSMKSE